MFEQTIISPSILSANFIDLGRDIRTVEDAGAEYIHIDVMDGHFVPNLTMGVPLVKQLAKTARATLDVHLMIDNPLTQLPWFLAAGAQIVSIHVETLTEAEMLEAIGLIHEAGALACVAIKPKTPVSVVQPYIEQLDMVLVMSVEPGFSGQSYIEGSDARVAEVAAMARAAGTTVRIEVDGGIGLKTAPLVAAAGADVLVCGNAVFASEDPATALPAIKQAAEQARLAAQEI